jgi:hypothetical protein
MMSRRAIILSACCALLHGRALASRGEKVIDYIAALGLYRGEPALRAFLDALDIVAEPVVHDRYSGFLQNYARGIELTFKEPPLLDIPLRQYPADVPVLCNIRFYGTKTKTHAPFTGQLPFKLRFGDSRRALIEKIGAPDLDGTPVGPMLRWDTERYAVYAQFSDDDTMDRLSLQLPYVRSTRPPF